MPHSLLLPSVKRIRSIALRPVWPFALAEFVTRPDSRAAPRQTPLKIPLVWPTGPITPNCSLRLKPPFPKSRLSETAGELHLRLHGVLSPGAVS